MDLLPNIHIRLLDLGNFQKLKMFHVKHFENYRISDKSFYSYLSQKQYRTAGAFFEDNLIGYIIFLVSESEADIVYIATHPEFRKKGVGGELLNSKCFTWNIRQNSEFKIFLEVQVDNLSAISFYLKHGFQVISLRKKYINGSDAYLMVKTMG